MCCAGRAPATTFPAEGVGGDGSPLRTLWDLWKWEIQEEQPVLHDLIDEMVESVIRGFVDQLPPEQGALMTLITDAQDDLDEDQAEPFFDREAVTAELLQRVSDRACDEPHRGEVQRYLDAVARDRFERDMEGSG